MEELQEVREKATKVMQGSKRGLKKFIRGTVLPIMDKMTPNNGNIKNKNATSPQKAIRNGIQNMTTESTRQLRLGMESKKDVRTSPFKKKKDKEFLSKEESLKVGPA